MFDLGLGNVAMGASLFLFAGMASLITRSKGIWIHIRIPFFLEASISTATRGILPNPEH